LSITTKKKKRKSRWYFSTALISETTQKRNKEKRIMKTQTIYTILLRVGKYGDMPHDTSLYRFESFDDAKKCFDKKYNGEKLRKKLRFFVNNNIIDFDNFVYLSAYINKEVYTIHSNGEKEIDSDNSRLLYGSMVEGKQGIRKSYRVLEDRTTVL
jgi:hypothetical protein